MSVFGDWAVRYFESGYSVTPIKQETKRPFLNEWQKACEHQTLEDVESLVHKFADCNIGLCCGPFSNIIAVDFDYTLPDSEQVENLIIAAIPPRRVMKKGKKGWTAFYRYSPDVICGPINKKYEKDEDRLVDILGNGKQTVMPESIHPETKKPYRWITSDTLFDIKASELPLFTNDHRMAILEIAKLSSDSDYRELSLGSHKRHDAVFNHVVRNIYKYQSLDQMVSDMIEFDRVTHEKHEKGPYFTDSNYLKGKSQKDFVTALAKRISNWKKKKDAEAGINWSFGVTKGGVDFQKSVLFFNKIMPATKKCILTKDIYYKENGEWRNVKNRIKALRSYARENDIKPTVVEDDLSRWTETLKPQILYDFETWDGFDHLGNACRRLKSSVFSPEEIGQIFKQWGVNMLLRLEDENNQNRCPILKGTQEIGKDYFIRSLFWHFKPYYMSVTPPDSVKDFLEIASRLLICHIEEFDQTAKINMGFLKSLITQPNQFFRESYGVAPDSKMTRPSFISTANVDELLKDPTGNRRFILIPVESIEWTNIKVNSAQVMAQLSNLAKNGPIELAESTALKIKDIIADFTPDGRDLTVIELWRDRAIRTYGEVDISPADASEIILGIASAMRCSELYVRSVLNRNGYKKKSNGVRYYVAHSEKYAKFK